MTLSDKITAGTATYDDFAPFGELHELAWRAYCPPEGSLDAAWRLFRGVVNTDEEFSLFAWSDAAAECGCNIGDQDSQYHKHPAIAVLLAVIDYRDQQ